MWYGIDSSLGFQGFYKSIISYFQVLFGTGIGLFSEHDTPFHVLVIRILDNGFV